MIDRIKGCVYRQRLSFHTYKCTNPIRAEGTLLIRCPHDGRRSPGVCLFYDDGAEQTAEEVA